MEHIAKRLVKLRQDKNLKIKNVANAIGVSPSTYRDWEYGCAIKAEEPYIKLARYYGVSISF